MKKKILSFIVFTFISLDLIAKEPKLEEIIKGLNGPWSLSFVDSSRILVTEKSGNIFLIDINDKELSKVNHNLNVLVDGQGGLLEVLYFNKNVFVSYSENRGKGKSIL